MSTRLERNRPAIDLERAVSGDDEEHCLSDLLEAPDDSQQREQHATVAGLLQQLTPRERAVVMQRYQLGRDAEHGIDHHIKYARLVRRKASTLRAKGADCQGYRYFVQLTLGLCWRMTLALE